MKHQTVFFYFGELCPPHPHLCLNFIFKILLNHYNVSFNSVGSASYIYNFMMVINWHLYFYYVLGKRSPMMPKENKVTNEFKDFSLCIRKRVLLGCCIPNFIILFALIKISEIQAEWEASHGRNNFFQNMKKEPNKRVHTKFHGSRWKINNFMTNIKRVSMQRKLPT